MPAPVPPLVETPETAPPELDFAAVKAELGGAQPGETVLLAELKQIILLEDASQLGTIQLAAGPTSNLPEFPHLDTEPLRGVIDLFVGESVSQESIQRLRLSLGLVLAEQGYPFSLVYTPPQDITDGVLQIVVKESQLGSLKINGGQYFSEQSYFGRLGLEPGGKIDSKAIQVGLDRINSNPFRSAAVQAERGAEPATTDVVLQVRERRPYRVFAGYNNTGTDVTTEDRMFVGFTLGNVWGLAHLMTLQATADFDVKHSKALSGNYSMDLPHNHNLSFSGAYSEIESVPNGGLDQEGTSWQTSVNYTIPLQSQKKEYRHHLEFGFDYKSSDNNLELNLPPFIIPISDNLTRVAQARIKYGGTLSDAWGSTRFGLELTYAPGGIGANNDDTSFAGSRALATADYLYGNITLFRDTPLSGGRFTGSSWTIRGELQLSDTNLLSSEQFSAGGSGSVRGYEEGEVIGDNAFFISQEFLLPAMNPILDLHFQRYTGSLRPFVFYDYARTWNTDKLAGEKPFNLMSVGTGIRYQVSRNATFNFAYGWQLKDSGSSFTGDNSRAHVMLQLSY